METIESAGGYAFWTAPDGSVKVVYSLAVMQEIDTFVNDGYRRIPHGGVETGGLLFGTQGGQRLQIEAFRPIECQHAYGPSFVLSASDLEALRTQIAESKADPALEGINPVGWFLGHTRSPLQLHDREVAWFDEFFPTPGSLTLLVKPERFQPTLFGFLLRRADRQMERDASHSAIILPLSGHASQTPERAAPAIPAPKPAEPKVERARDEERATPVPLTGSTTRVREPRAPEQEEPPSPFASAIEKTRVAAETAAVPRPPRRPPPVEEPPPAPRIELPDRTRYAIERPRQFAGLNMKSAAVLVLAAVLGCLAGYWAYLQLPSPVIPVSVRERGTQLTVEWPAAQTAGAEYAAIQVNNGAWIALTGEQKAAGQAVVTAPSGDVRIDLLSKHWLRDSRGIVRYIRTSRSR